MIEVIDMSSFKRSQFHGLKNELEALGEKKLISILEDFGFKVEPKYNRQTIQELLHSEYARNLEYWDLPIRFDDDWNKKRGVTTDNWNYLLHVGYTGFFHGERRDTILSDNRIDLFPVAGNSYVDGHFLVEAFRVLRAKKDMELIYSLYCKLDDYANSILTNVPTETDKKIVIKTKALLNHILSSLGLPEETYEFKEETYHFEPPKQFSIDTKSTQKQTNSTNKSTKKPSSSKKKKSNSTSRTKKK